MRATQPLKILIVDDNVDAADTLGEFLSGLGHEVCVAHDGKEGLALGLQMAPDVSILDLDLPSLDGYELARSLRNQLGRRSGRIIALSGYETFGRQTVVETPFTHRIVKPVDLDQLLQLVRG